MALDVEVGTFTKDTATPTGSNVVSTSFQPKALIIWGDHLSTSETERDGDLVHSFGYSDGVNDRALSVRSTDESALVAAFRSFRTADCIAFMDSTPSLVAAGNADFNATDFTINWTTNDATATRIHYIVYGGADITGVQVGHFNKSVTTTVPVNQDIPTDSDVRGITNGKGMVMFFAHRGTNQNGFVSNVGINIGLATSDDGNQEGDLFFGEDSGSASAETRQAYSETYALGIYNPASGAINVEAKLNAWLDDGTNGFQLRYTTNTTASGWRVAFLIIKGGQWECGNETASTSVTTKTTTTKFRPKGLFNMNIRRTTEGIAQADASLGIGASDATTESSCNVSSKDGTAETHEGGSSSITESVRVLTPLDPGAPIHDAEADVDSFNVTDFILDWTDAAGSAWKFLWLICGDAINVFDRTASQTITESDAVVTVPGKARTAIQTITESDTVAQLGVYARTVAQSITQSNAVSRILAALRTASQSITESDAAVRVPGVARTASQTVTESDSVTTLGVYARPITQSVTESDSVSRLGVFARTASQTITESDAVAAVKGFVRSASQTITQSDSVVRLLVQFRTVSQTITEADVVASVKAFTRTAVQTITESDIVSRIQVLIRTAVQTITESEIVVAVKTAGAPITIRVRAAVAYLTKRTADAILTKRTSSAKLTKRTAEAFRGEEE